MAARGEQARDLEAWLVPFLTAMGRKTRRRWAPFYLRGLLGPGDRKSLQPMAARLGLPGPNQLQHFIVSPAWNDRPLWTALAREADRLVGGAEAVLVIDDTALPKKSTLPVGVARQYCGALGRQANCQSLVSLTLARDEVPVPVALQLFLPDEWTDDAGRCVRAGVPEDRIAPRTKGEIALAELDRVRAAGAREQAHQQLKEELGLDHYKERSWTGLHRHALMTCLAFAYLQHLRLTEQPRAGRGKKDEPSSRPAALAQPARRAPGHRRTAARRRPHAQAMPALPATAQPAV